MTNTEDICTNNHGDNAESVAANDRSLQHRTDQQQRVLDAIKDAPDGLTMKELAEQWGCQLNTISGRASELKKLGMIEKSGQTRNGSAVLVPTARVFSTGGIVSPEVSQVGDRITGSLPISKPSASPHKPSYAYAEDSDPFEHQRLVYARYEAGQ